MEKYFLCSFIFDSDNDFEAIYERVFSSVGPAFSKFYTLVGQYSSDFSHCIVESLDFDNSSFLKKVRVHSGDTSIFVYLQKVL